MNKFVIKCFDGFIYIIEGKYKNAKELDEYLTQFEKVDMPNGDRIRVSSIDKIISYESYKFQIDQIQRHRKGQFLSIENDQWRDQGGVIDNANLKSITGLLSSGYTQKKLTRGK